MAILIRPVRDTDTAPIVAFFRKNRTMDETMPAVSQSEWNAHIDQEVNRGGRDFRVAEDSGSIVGVATSSLRVGRNERVRHFRVLVAPDRRRERIGTRLLVSLVAIDRPRDGVLLQSLCPAEWMAMRAFLTRWRFGVIETELVMCRTGPAPPPIAPPVANGRIEFVSELSLYAAPVATLHNAAYQQDVSFVSYSSEGMAACLTAGGQLWVLRLGEELAGYIHLQPETDMTWIESVVIDPNYQRLGLGKWLLATVLSKISEQYGGSRMQLRVVRSNAGAVRLYESVGFVPVSESLRFRASRDTVAQLTWAHLNRAMQEAQSDDRKFGL